MIYVYNTNRLHSLNKWKNIWLLIYDRIGSFFISQEVWAGDVPTAILIASNLVQTQHNGYLYQVFDCIQDINISSFYILMNKTITMYVCMLQVVPTQIYISWY